MITEIKSPQRYSILACPNGCSRSAGFPARTYPTRTKADDPASDRLFTASATTETLPVIRPSASLAAKRTTLTAIPTPPAILPTASRPASPRSLYFETIYFVKSVFFLNQNKLRRIRQRTYPIAEGVPFVKLMAAPGIIHIYEILVIEGHRPHLII